MEREPARQAKDGVGRHLINLIEAVDEYLGHADRRVNTNTNQGYSVDGLILNVAGKTVASY